MATKTTTQTSYRWRILALLFAATTINYMDRSILGVLAPTLQYHVFHWTDNQFAWINVAFKAAYAIGLLTMGGLIDRLGSRIGYTLSIGIWSLFGMLHALVKPAFGFVGFIFARFGLGFGEAGNFPAANKTIAEWFPKKDRAFAFGLVNAGSNVGAVLAPLLIPLIVAVNGDNWQYAFLLTGGFSLVWVILWLIAYKKPEDHPKVSTSELDYINSDNAVESKERIPWIKVLGVKQTWGFAIGKLTDAAWFFYLFWGGKFLHDQFGLNIKELALPLITIYVLADVGSILGGYTSSAFIKKGWTVNKARKLTMLGCAILILPVMFSVNIDTVFSVNEQFYNKIKVETYKKTQVVEVNGKYKNQKVEKNIPQTVVEQLTALEGKIFTSGRDFIEAVKVNTATIVPAGDPDYITRMEPTIVDAARSNNKYWIAIILIAIAAASHQAWSANLYTIVSDVFPKKATASVSGIGGMVGISAAMAVDIVLGSRLTDLGTNGYFIVFFVAGIMYTLILGIIHLVMPQLKPLDENLNIEIKK